MRVTKVHAVYQMSFMPHWFPVNCYLVEEESSLTLVDAAMSYSWKGILRVASSIGKPITRIVLTHAHADHVGALDQLKAALPEVEVCISERDSRLLAGDFVLRDGEPTVPIKGGFVRRLKTRPDRLIRDGERIGSLTAIAAPGHTPGQMAFLDTRHGIMIAGDAFQTRGGIAVSGIMRPTFPFPALATWSKELALQTARKLRTYEPEVLAVGHGDMIHDAVVQMDLAIADATRRKPAHA